MKSIPINPASFQVVPFRGYLNLIIDPAATLANPDGAQMVAEVWSSLTKSQGRPVNFSARDLETLIHNSQVPAGKKMMLVVH